MEKVDIVDITGSYMRTQERIDNLEMGEYIKSVHAYLIDENNNVLIQQRSESKLENPNLWEVVGGGVMAGEDVDTAIIREISEETGLSVSPKDLHFMGKLICEKYLVHAYVARISSKSVIKPCEIEVKNQMLVNPEELEVLIQNDRFYSSSYALFLSYISKTKLL